MPNELPIVFDDDNPVWTKADFAKAEHFDGVPLVEVEAARRSRRRPAG